MAERLLLLRQEICDSNHSYHTQSEGPYLQTIRDETLKHNTCKPLAEDVFVYFLLINIQILYFWYFNLHECIILSDIIIFEASLSCENHVSLKKAEKLFSASKMQLIQESFKIVYLGYRTVYPEMKIW